MTVAAGGVAIREGQGHTLAWRLSLAACLVAGAVFFLFPEIDLWLTRAPIRDPDASSAGSTSG